MTSEEMEKVKKLAEEHYTGNLIRVRGIKPCNVPLVRKGDTGKSKRGAEVIFPNDVVDVIIGHNRGDYHSPLALATLEHKGKFARVDDDVELTDPPADDPYLPEKKRRPSGEVQQEIYDTNGYRAPPTAPRGIHGAAIQDFIRAEVEKGVKAGIADLVAKSKKQPPQPQAAA